LQRNLKHWEIVADKSCVLALVLGLLQRRYPRWLALDC